MNIVDLTEHVGTIATAAAAVGCSGGFCARELLSWWQKRAPIRAARRARRRARRGDRG